MKNLALGIVVALVLAVVAYITYPVFKNLGFLGGKTVAPYQLQDDAKNFGNLKVTVTWTGNPASNLEVDLGQQGGRKTAVKTDADGVAFFENVPVGSWSIFFNERNFPKEYTFTSNLTAVTIEKNQLTEKNIELGQTQ